MLLTPDVLGLYVLNGRDLSAAFPSPNSVVVANRTIILQVVAFEFDQQGLVDSMSTNRLEITMGGVLT